MTRRRLTSDISAADDIVGPSFMITKEGGFATLLTNKTGGDTMKGMVVSASGAVDGAFVLQANTYDAFGIVYEDGVDDGQTCWMVTTGQADVLVEDGHAVTRGQLMLCSTTDGRATSVDRPDIGLPGTDQHFTEIGHAIESKGAGTNVRVRCVIHFN